MARTREFDTSAALDTAMMVFWEHGYEATSFNDIVKATGVSRYGLYDEFDSKKGLYLASLRHYFNQMMGGEMNSITHPDATIADIRSMFDNLIAMHESGMEHGCMFCNAANEMAQQDEEVAELVRECFFEIKRYFAQAIQNSVDAGELPKDTDVETISVMILGLMQGGATFIRVGMPLDMIHRYMHSALNVLI